MTFSCNESYITWGSGNSKPEFPSAFCSSFAGSTYLNLQGAISSVPLYPQTPSTLRVVVLGDSYTEGINAPLLFNYPNILQELIPGSEIINFGQSGIGIDSMYTKYQTEARNLSSHVIILGIFVEDVMRAGSICGGWIKPVLDENLSYKALSPSPEEVLSTQNRRWLRSAFMDYTNYAFHNFPCQDTRFERGMSLLRQILLVLREEHAQLIIGIIISDIYDAQEQEQEEEIIDLVEELRIPYVRSRPLFENYASQYRNKLGGDLFENYLQPFFSKHHFSVYGNALYAQALRDKIAEIGIIPPGKQFSFLYAEHTLAFYVKQDEGYSLEKVLTPLTFLNMTSPPLGVT